ncbi:hypothetical protein OCC_02887 [Thermococcus litoralis DSM 5473]|uniref:Uncharacterized protein n=1 Tax=Thermococcus litoralis (strain ATCC 51850 / DSM 5473 / JCM 8560 / NS-C) TaxID=523849 RepID=H3ZPZ9_THELN|nr:hypothetical protein [Thermococcus litoralis]EHR77962.1 hypothetical protein OCC_02887 [Thermococcus litoralis DSM 5473]
MEVGKVGWTLIALTVLYAVTVLVIQDETSIMKLNSVLQVLIVAFIALQTLATARNVDESIKSRLNIDELKYALIGYLEEEVLPKMQMNARRDSNFEKIQPVKNFLKQDYTRARSQYVDPVTRSTIGYKLSVTDLGYILRMARKVDMFLKNKKIDLESYNKLIESKRPSDEVKKENERILEKIREVLEMDDTKMEEELLKLH